MAVAAYATLRSLSHVLDNLQHPVHLRQLHVDPNQIKSLQENVQFLLGFLEAHSQGISEEIGDLGRQIADAAVEAEEVVDRHVVDQLRYRSQEKSHCMAALSSFRQDIDKVIGKINSLAKELTMMVKEQQADVQEEQRIVSVHVTPSEVLSSSGKKSTMVGFDDHLVCVMDELTRSEPNLQILSIVGMGGIGKTTLAQNVFDHPYIVHYFSKRIWVKISQEYNIQEILSCLLNNGEKHKSRVTSAELGQRLYHSLFGERYLIVMDDIWSTKAWDDLKLFLPNNKEGSRVMVTTRESSMATSLGSHKSYLLDFLNEEKSWNLFCHKALGQESCPYPELEEIGRNIAKSCNGLPLTIIVIGGLLANSNMTREYWDFVAKNMNTFRNSKDYERCLKILSLSYNNLPIHLKPCLLYLRFYPEHSKIGVSKLTKQWIAEGFLKPIRGKSLEEAAEKYLRDLIDRNLILSLKSGYDGNIKTCGIHDLLRDLCLREYEKEHFVYVPKFQHVIVGSRMNDEDCFLCGFTSTLQRMDLNEVHDASQLTSVASVLVCDTCRNMYPSLNKTRLIRVKLVKPIKWYGESSEEEILHPTTLRYLETHNLNNLELYSPSSIIFVWNQEIVHMYSYSTNTLLLPSKFWDMTQLRHLNASNVVLPDPAVTQDSIIMENLQSLSNIRNFRCTEEVLKRIPNLKKLGISFYEEKRGIDWSYYCLYNLVRLQKLESLSVKGKDLSLENLTFPTSLKKLSLNACNIPWEKMTNIGCVLPNLERLKLEANTFDGPEWNQVEGEFPQLKVLKIYHNVHLKWWRAEKIHFPNLESLILRLMFKLLEIPSVIGDIPTLHSISVEYCNDSLIDSAKQIVEEQHDNGNDSLQLYIDEKRYQVGS